MSRSFTYRWKSSRNNPNATLVVATASSTFEKEEITTLLDEDHQRNLYPDVILFIVPGFVLEAYLAALRAWLAGETALRMDTSRVAIYMAPFDHHGECDRFLHVAGLETNWRTNAFAEAKTSGLKAIFAERKVLMRPGAGMHFAHPKGVHSRSFLRGANALVNGTEIRFLAMTLLPYMRETPKQIWLDTSSIASLAFAMIALRLQFDPGFDPPHVESFSSYEKLETTKFKHATRSLFLISATASGSMARRIMEKERVEKARVVNLFSGAEHRNDITVHCDVHDHEDVRAPGGESLLRIAPADNCPWCQDSSRLLRFVSDQFLADAIEYTPVLINEDDAPSGLKALAERYIRRGFFLLKRGASTNAHRFWVEPTAVMEENDRKADLATAVRRYVPLATSHVVHLEDPASALMAARVAGQIEAFRGSPPEIVAAKDAGRIDRSKADGVVVVAACIGSGNKLQVVSRDLRDVLDDNPRTYVIAFAKQGEPRRRRSLRSDLVHGKVHPHEFVTIETMTLPEGELNAWCKEMELLLKLRDEHLSGEVAAFINARINELSAETIGSDLKLFLGAPTGTPLKLSAGFAFYETNASVEGVTHGDVLATIAAILHHLRTHVPKAGTQPRLSSTTSHTCVLAPGVFGRFNDGVIQAALLRAAHAHELNYGSRADLSGAMLRIVQRALERWNASQGEACLEFLLALASKRMVLTDPDLKILRATIFDDMAPAHLKMYLDAATRSSEQSAAVTASEASFGGVHATQRAASDNKKEPK